MGTGDASMPHGHAHHCKSKCDYYTTHHTLVLENVEHCGGEPEQAATMATCT